MKQIVIAVLALTLNCALTFANDDTEAKAAKAMEEKDYVHALDLYRGLIAAKTTNTQILYNTGICYLVTEELDSAAEMFEQTAALLPDFKNVYLNLGMLYAKQQKSAKSVENYTKYLRFDSSNIRVLFNRGVGCITLSRFAEAYRDLSQCKKLQADARLSEKITFILEQLGDRNPSSETKEHSDSHGVVSCTLPAAWHVRTEDDDKTLNFFVSAEKVEKADDLFTLGVTVRLIRRLSRSISEIEGKDPEFVVDFWKALSDKGGFGLMGYDNYAYHKELQTKKQTVDNVKMTIITRELQMKSDTYRLITMDCLAAFNDSILTITFEAPADEFESFRPVFERALASFKVKTK